VDEDVRRVMEARADEARARRRTEGLRWTEAEPLLDALESAGIDPVDFGSFGAVSFTTFDFERAVPVLVEWLPRVDDPRVKESMVRSLAGQRGARGVGAQRLIEEFRRPEYAEESSLRWAIGNTLATIAGPADADGIIEILRDRSGGMARQMLCDALGRTRDPRRVDVLIDLIDDDSVAGHAILALRRIGRRALPRPERLQPMLDALLARPSATEFAQQQARVVLRTLDPPDRTRSAPRRTAP
jgi:HEAT repeat protein